MQIKNLIVHLTVPVTITVRCLLIEMLFARIAHFRPSLPLRSAAGSDSVPLLLSHPALLLDAFSNVN